LTLFTGSAGLTTSTSGADTVLVIGAKSFTGSYESFLYSAGATARLAACPITTW